MTIPQLKTSNELAEERTGLAAKRTVMAAHRTLMVWVRTALIMSALGLFLFVSIFVKVL